MSQSLDKESIRERPDGHNHPWSTAPRKTLFLAAVGGLKWNELRLLRRLHRVHNAILRLRRPCQITDEDHSSDSLLVMYHLAYTFSVPRSTPLRLLYQTKVVVLQQVAYLITTPCSRHDRMSSVFHLITTTKSQC